MKPKANDPLSPIIPINIGIAPAPKSMPIGTVRETATFRELAGPISERAANPAGKKQPASAGCRKTATTTHKPGMIPRSTVVIPVSRRLPGTQSVRSPPGYERHAESGDPGKCDKCICPTLIHLPFSYKVKGKHGEDTHS